MTDKYAQLVKRIEQLRNAKYIEATEMHEDAPTFKRRDSRRAYELYTRLMADVDFLERFGEIPDAPAPDLSKHPF